MRQEFTHLLTPVGMLIAQWSENGLYACELHPSGSDSGEVDPTEPRSSGHEKLEKKLIAALICYFESGTFAWQLDNLDWSNVSDFQKTVLEACCRIPAGQTRTYGQLAAQTGRPKAARAVGRAMATNRWPLIIPCHRVVGSQGRLTGYSGGQGITTKKLLLDFEAAVISGADSAENYLLRNGPVVSKQHAELVRYSAEVAGV